MERNISRTTTTDFTNLTDLSYEVESKNLDTAGAGKETEWTNPFWGKYLGYLKTLPEYKEPIRALARWTVGKGYDTDNRTKVILDSITGWGEDSFQSILTSMIIIKKTNGDAYAEIIRDDDGKLINLKPLDPGKIKIIVNQKGLIIRYEEWGIQPREFKRNIEVKDMLHLCNDRVGNEIHGTSALEACQWELDAKRECMETWRKLVRLSSMRVIYVDMDNQEKLSALRSQWQEGIKNREVILLPGIKGKDVEIIDYQIPPIQPYLEWLRYLDNRIYQSLGVPKAIADTADFTEAASKVGYMTFEPVYTEEQALLEQDLWNQLAISVRFNRPPSLSGVMQESEAKNTGQLGIQPNEVTATAGRVE